MNAVKEALNKLFFRNSGYGKVICPCCGDRFEYDDIIIRISMGDRREYFHEDCLSEMSGKEALEMFKAEIEEVEI